MNLWLLRPLENIVLLNNSAENPWFPWYDKCFGMVIRAETENAARELANDNGSEEIRGRHFFPWLDVDFSTCDLLLNEGDKEIIISDVHNGNNETI